MAIIDRTKFSDGWVLEKARAIALSAREPLPAAQRIMNLVHEAVPHYTWSGLWLRRERSLRLAFHRGNDASPPDTVEPLDGFLGWAVRSRRTQVLPDAFGDARYERIEVSVKSEIAVPVKVQGHAVGLLNVCSTEASVFGPLDRVFLEGVAGVLAPLVTSLRVELVEPRAAAFSA